MWKLEFYKGDKTLLQDLVNKIDALNRADYSEGSWNAMLPVLTEAKDVLADIASIGVMADKLKELELNYKKDQMQSNAKNRGDVKPGFMDS
mgnify:CR=1 FL=1